jgi:hypothetical protein
MERNFNKDLSKLADAYFKHLQIGDCEYGGWGLDDKRPFGNSFVEGDILEIIGAKLEGDDEYGKCWSSEQIEYANDLYSKLGNFLTKEWKRLKNKR